MYAMHTVLMHLTHFQTELREQAVKSHHIFLVCTKVCVGRHPEPEQSGAPLSLRLTSSTRM